MILNGAKFLHVLVFIDALNRVQSCQRKVRATLTSPRVARQAPGDWGGRAWPQHHRLLLLRNTDGDSEEKETPWEYAQHLQEPTRIFHGVPRVTPAKIIDKIIS